MRTQVYATYVQSSAAGYAEDNITSGRWPKEGAMERSLAEFESLLPQGLATLNNHLFEILAAEGGPTVGCIWFAVEERHGIRGAFLYDVEVKSEFRRQGHAKRAFQALEPKSPRSGCRVLVCTCSATILALRPCTASLATRSQASTCSRSSMCQVPNPSIERTVTSGLRPLVTAAHVKR